MALGPLMLDLAGYEITVEERELLMHPQVGGVILFTRNYVSPSQIAHLVENIHALRHPHLLVAVDHEGGTVQRFKEGFTLLPAAASLGRIYDRDKNQALQVARSMGWLMAVELRAVGVDFSFAPVLDLAHGVSGVIGTRALHRAPEAVAQLAHAYMLGMRDAGMAAVGKHFPGHGGVKEDSHISKASDSRSFEDLQLSDLLPFERMVHYGLPAIMPAHVVYSALDDKPAGYSKKWLHSVLRQQMGFQGVIFSDDLSMLAADLGNDYAARADLALAAGCDMVLVCNHPQAARQVAQHLDQYNNPASQMRLVRMHGKKAPDLSDLMQFEQWQQATRLAVELCEKATLEMNI